MYAGLEIGGFASTKANHFWGKCESLWPTDSQYFWVTVNQFRPIADHFCKRIRKSALFREVLLNKEHQCIQIANHC